MSEVCSVCGGEGELVYPDKVSYMLCENHSHMTTAECEEAFNKRNDRVVRFLGRDVLEDKPWVHIYFPGWADEYGMTFREYAESIREEFSNVTSEHMYNNYIGIAPGTYAERRKIGAISERCFLKNHCRTKGLFMTELMSKGLRYNHDIKSYEMEASSLA